MKLLVLCTGNSCRSQMAEGFLKYYADDIGFNIDIVSAGVETHGLNPRAIKSMKEVGVDISKQTSNNVEQYLDSGVTHLFSVCDHAKESCPIFPEKVIHIHESFPDPAKAEGTEEEIMASFRKTRELVDEYCCNLIFDLFSGAREKE